MEVAETDEGEGEGERERVWVLLSNKSEDLIAHSVYGPCTLGGEVQQHSELSAGADESTIVKVWTTIYIGSD